MQRPALLRSLIVYKQSGGYATSGRRERKLATPGGNTVKEEGAEAADLSLLRTGFGGSVASLTRVGGDN